MVAMGVLLAGCAAPSGVMLPEDTLLLGEVRDVLTRELVNAGRIAPGHQQANLAEVIRNRGWTDAQIDQGRVVVVRTLIYWFSSVGSKYEELSPELLSDGLAVEPGNVVELTAGPHGVITRVRARDLVEGGCYYGNVAVGTSVEVLGALSLMGPRGSASLYCAGIEREGWQRPRTYWHRLPGAVADPTGIPAAPPLDIASSKAVGTASHGDLAVLILFRARDNKFANTPISIDGEKASELQSGTCDIVLVSPGEHVVTAGSAESASASSWLPGWAPFPKTELKIVVGAGEHAVIEYIVDTRRLGEMFSALAAPFRAEKWAAEVFRLEMRPAHASDSCALDHEPFWRGRPMAGPE